jgi:ESX secretion-associated protein EspG
VTATLVPQLDLTVDELVVMASCLGIHDLPTVLAIRSHHGTVDARDAAHERAREMLMSRNRIGHGGVPPDVASVLQALHRPNRELAMRLVTPDGTARVSVVRRGTLCVLARRVGDRIVLRTIGHDVELHDAAVSLLAELPPTGPADIQPVGAPTREMSRSLSGSHDATGLADQIAALGVEPRSALLLGTALASRQAFAEIVYYALADDEGRISRGPAAVAVFYTKRGRIVAVPSASPAGDAWTTLKAGSDHVFGQAIGQLVELSDEGWEDSQPGDQPTSWR